MCSGCRHPEIHKSVIPILREEFDLDVVFLGDMKECLKAVSSAIRSAKVERRNQRRNGDSTWAIDARLKSLRFGAWVLNESRKDKKEGREPWLNGYRNKVMSPWKPHIFI